MPHSRACTALIFFALTAAPPRLSAAFPGFEQRTHVEVDVVVDMTPEGRKLVHPTPEHPAFYLPVTGDFQERGSIAAGEKPPVAAEFLHVVAVELARQGYRLMRPGPNLNASGQITYADGTVVTVPERPGPHQSLRLGAPGNVPLTMAMLRAPSGPYSFRTTHAQAASLRRGDNVQPLLTQVLWNSDPVHGPVLAGMPSIILVIAYGYINPDVLGSSDASSSSPMGFFNQNEMLALVAGHTLDNIGFDFEQERKLATKAEENRYFAVISAYDLPKYREHRKKVLLWQAKMSAPSQGLGEFSEIMTALVKAGGPFFGRETRLPQSLVLPVTPEGRVEVGTPTVKGN